MIKGFNQHFTLNIKLTYPDLLIFHFEDRSKNSRRAELGEAVAVIN